MPITEQRVDARDTLLAPQAVRREFQTLPASTQGYERSK
jgi:hypothetical protein